MTTAACSRMASIQMVTGAVLQDNLRTAEQLLTQAAERAACLAALPEFFPIMGLRDTDKVKVRERFGADGIASVIFTGSHGQEIAARLGAPWEPETVAQIVGVAQVAPGARRAFLLGGRVCKDKSDWQE